MKKLVCIVVFVVFAMSFAGGTVALAEDLCYTVPQGQTITMYYLERVGLDANTAQFWLPYGYTFATVGVDEDGYTPVSFGGMEGLVATAQLQALSASNVAEALPEVAVRVDDLVAYRFVSTTDKTTRESLDLAPEEKLLYLGNYTYNGVDYYAVRSSERPKRLLFVVKAHTNTDEVEAAVHPKAQDNTPPAGSDATPSSTSLDSGFTWVRFVLILGIIVPLITIVLMILRPHERRRKPQRVIDDEADGDDYDGIDDV